MSWARAAGDGVDLDVQVVPRSSRSRVAGVSGDRLKVQLHAPPVDGEANRALIELLAALLGVRKSAVAIVSGEAARAKRVHVVGVGLETVLALGPAA